MQYLETIKLQAASGQEIYAERELSALVDEVNNTDQHAGIQVAEYYKHASIPGSFTILLVWNVDSLPSEGSLIGLRLIQALKTFGMTAHAVWHKTVNTLSS